MSARVCLGLLPWRGRGAVEAAGARGHGGAAAHVSRGPGLAGAARSAARLRVRSRRGPRSAGRRGPARAHCPHHCDSLTEPGLAVSCHQGVFMEAITVALNPGQDHTAHASRPRAARRAQLRRRSIRPIPTVPATSTRTPMPIRAGCSRPSSSCGASGSTRDGRCASATRLRRSASIAAMRVSVSRSPASSSAVMPGWQRSAAWGAPSGRPMCLGRSIGLHRDGLVGRAGQTVLRLAAPRLAGTMLRGGRGRAGTRLLMGWSRYCAERYCLQDCRRRHDGCRPPGPISDPSS